jgi:multidrug efflux pump subunit AcrB
MVRFSIKYIHAILVLAILLVVLGTVAVSSLPVDILPAFRSPAVQVMTYYSGMPTSSVERTITNRIERWTNQATGVREVESRSTMGVSVVRLKFRDDIDPTAALTQVNSLALGTLPTLPPNTLPPVVLPYDPTASLPLSVLSVRGEGLSETALKDLARIQVRNMLGGVKGVVAPAVFGGKDRTILIYVDPDKLQARNLSPLDVVEALQRANLMVTPGVAKFGGYEFQLDSNAMVSSVSELNDIPIRTNRKGTRTYLRDIGHATDASTIQTALVRIDGKRQVYVPIYRQQGASSLAVVDAVKREIPRMEQNLAAQGEEAKLDLVMDQSSTVREAIEALLHEGALGIVLVGVMILFFLGNARMTFIATLAIPLAVLCSLTGLAITGNTINAMTLGGLALAIGPLVDNAIVVLENTHRHQMMGKSPLLAAHDGASEVTLPVLVATICTIIVLCPIALMPGMGGFLFRPLTLALAFAMIASFVLSQTLVPALCSRLLKAHHPHPHETTPTEATAHGDHGAHGDHTAHAAPARVGWFQRAHLTLDAFLTWLNGIYLHFLNGALQRRGLVLTGAVLLFLASFAFLLGIGQEFFPQVDAGQITMQVRSPSGTNLEAAEQRIAEVEQFLKENIPAKDRKMIISEMGLVPDWSAAYTLNAGTQDTTIKIQLAEHHRSKSSAEYASILRKRFDADPRFADLRASFDTGGLITAALNQGSSSPVDIQITGGTTSQAMELAQRVRDNVSLIRGTADVRVVQRLDAQQRIVVIDRKKAADIGLDMASVIKQVATAMNSSISISKNFWIDYRTGNQYYVAVQYPEDSDRRIEDVLNIPATGTNVAHPVKLGTLIRLEQGTAPVEVNHINLARVFNVMVNTDGKDVGYIARRIDQRIREVQKASFGTDPIPADVDGAILFPNGMRVQLKGEYSRMMDSFGGLGFGLVLAMVLIYLLLVALFRSFLGPLVILGVLPLGLIGVFAILFFTGTTLNVQSSMGIIFMVGIVVANGVLLVDFANKRLRSGMTPVQAMQDAAQARFRAILMTVLATFLDLLPMALAPGANAPLARAVIGGLLAATALTLFIVPILYTLLTGPVQDTDAQIDAELQHSTV